MNERKTERAICKGCSQEYERKVVTLFRTPISFDGGYCLKCRDELRAQDQAREETAREAAIRAKREEWRKSCGIPPKFMTERFSTFEKQKQLAAYKLCVAYAEEYPLLSYHGYPSLLLFSEHSWGVGKSHLVSAIPHRILDRWNGEEIRCPIHFVTEPDLFEQIQATFNYTLEQRQFRQSESDILHGLVTVPLLILDDVGKTKRADLRFVQRTLFSIIDGRYRSKRSLVLTTNLSPENLELYLGGVQADDKADKSQADKATMDRLIEMCQGKAKQMEGPSYRRRKKEGGKLDV